MIKKHEIIKSYEVFLYCDDCKEKVFYNKFNVKTERFEHICPKCGRIYETDQSYPYMMNEYDIEGEEL